MEFNFRFIDLFAGIGGFHQAMSALGGRCVYASEIDPHAIQTYAENYKIDSSHDVKTATKNNLPEYDVLCAGFPCQAFSKAGARRGFDDKTKGTLFFEVRRILGETRPKYFILENVRNLLSHDGGNTIKVIKESLSEVGYNYIEVMMSPHQLGIPQLRERIYILGIRKDIYSNYIDIDIPTEKNDKDIYMSGIIDRDVDEKYKISPHKEMVLSCWNDFYQGIVDKIIGFPVWADEFKRKHDVSGLPKWKADFCIKNRKLYARNMEFIDCWLEKYNDLQGFTPTERKLEWQAGDSISSIWDGLIQFRPSGVRVKRPNYFPALVAMVQIPIIGRLKRKMTPREAARLQSFPDSFVLNPNDSQAYKQLGNSVNVKCVEYLARQLFRYGNLNIGIEVLHRL